MPWSSERSRSAGGENRSRSSTRIWASRLRASPSAQVSHSSPPMWPFSTWAWWRAWMSRAWRATTRTGIASSPCVASPTSCSPMPMRLSPCPVQRPPRPRAQRHHVRAGTAHPARAAHNGGIRHKAERGTLRRGLSVGLIWGEKEGEGGPVPFRRGRHQCDPRRLRALRRARVGPPGLALIPHRGLVLPLAVQGDVQHPTSAGWHRPRRRSTKSSPVRCTLAPTSMGRPAASASSTGRA